MSATEVITPSSGDELRALYEGDQAVTIAMLKRRFVGSAAGAASQNYDETARNMLVSNELKPLIDERIEAVPSDFSFEADEPVPIPGSAALPLTPAQKLAFETQEWAEGPVTPDGFDLYALFDSGKADQEIAGNVALVLGKFGSNGTRPGEVWVQSRDATPDRAIPAFDDPANPCEVTSWTFKWIDSGRKMVETFTLTERTLTVNGLEAEREALNLGFLPVIVMPRRIIKGSRLGDSGVRELEQAYLNFLWIEYLRNLCNKNTAFRVWCPGDDVTAMALQGDNDGTGATSIKIRPGVVFKYNLDPRGGDISLESVENQRADSLETLRRLGRGEEDADQRGDQRVAKAMVLGRRGLQRYAAGKIVFLKAMLMQVAAMRYWLLNPAKAKQPVPIVVEFPDLQDSDPIEQRERGKLWMEAFKVKLATPLMVFKQWQRLKLLDEDEDIEAMAASIEALGEAEAMASMERMMTLAGQRGAPAPADGSPAPSSAQPPPEMGGDA